MNRHLLAAMLASSILASPALMISDASAAAKSKSKSMWNEKSAEEVKAAVDKMNRAWEQGDYTAMRNLIAADDFIGAWDLDPQGKPMAMTNIDDVIGMLQSQSDMMKKMNAQMKMKTTSIECKADAMLGFCAQEQEMTMIMPNMPSFTLTFRSTEIVRKGADGWKFIQHHGSVAKAPEMPAKFLATSMDDAKWEDIPNMPGIKAVSLWMNPLTQQMAAIMKLPAGYSEARHIHPNGMTFSLLQGSLTTTDQTGKDHEFKAGSVLYRAANEPHTTSSKMGAIAMVVTDGPMASIAVDANNRPVAPKSASK